MAAHRRLRCDRTSCSFAGPRSSAAAIAAQEEDQLLSAVAQDARLLELASLEQRRDRRFVMRAVRCNGLALRYASADVQADREVVLTAVKHNGMALEFAGSEVRADKEVVMSAVENNEAAFAFAAGAARHDKECAAAADKSGFLRNDRAFVLSMVHARGASLKSASLYLRSDAGIVLAAIRQDGLALEAAAPKLRDIENIVTVAVKQNGLALAYASEKLRANRRLVELAVKQNGLALEFASAELRGDPDIVLRAITTTGHAVRYASPRLRADPLIAMSAVKQDGLALQHLGKSFRSDRTTVLEAATQSVQALSYASENLKRDHAVEMVAKRKGKTRALFGQDDARRAARSKSCSNLRKQVVKPVSDNKVLVEDEPLPREDKTMAVENEPQPLRSAAGRRLERARTWASANLDAASQYFDARIAAPIRSLVCGTDAEDPPGPVELRRNGNLPAIKETKCFDKSAPELSGEDSVEESASEMSFAEQVWQDGPDPTEIPCSSSDAGEFQFDYAIILTPRNGSYECRKIPWSLQAFHDCSSDMSRPSSAAATSRPTSALVAARSHLGARPHSASGVSGFSRAAAASHDNALRPRAITWAPSVADNDTVASAAQASAPLALEPPPGPIADRGGNPEASVARPRSATSAPLNSATTTARTAPRTPMRQRSSSTSALQSSAQAAHGRTAAGSATAMKKLALARPAVTGREASCAADAPSGSQIFTVVATPGHARQLPDEWPPKFRSQRRRISRAEGAVELEP
eukprot:TRINITY_DN18936_c0_g1_i1.p1 TRINITY_DN18936_c0_g1~~TRINITY_DN18936_c0_g1_i1.p1  ORF type:complete len:755 (+),score=124.05 TRINITY_DN18936_c0_g1_i1:392-2656(+)